MKTSFKFLFFICILFFNHKIQAQQPTDCIDSVIICGNSSVNLDVSGVGVQELDNSNTCGSSEHNSIWLQVKLVSAGTLGFTLRPKNQSIEEDYDFFVFGPNVPCNNLGQAIRCSTTNPEAANLSNNYTGMRTGEGDTSEGPGPNGNSFVKSLDVSAGDTYFIVIDRPIGNSGFTLEWTGTAQFSSPPVNEASTLIPLDFEKCDVVTPYDDGFTTFNLELNTPIIMGSQVGVTISYHLSESDANIDINPLTSPYTNIKNPQKIYTRITNIFTGCFEITDFSLLVNLGPNFQKPTALEICDSNSDGDSYNGFAFFDLESKNSEILQGQDPTSINITYHESSASAESNTAAISSLYYNTTAHQQQIFVRLEDALNVNCRSFTTLDLIVNPLPDAFDATLIQCDEEGIQDGRTMFNLDQAKAAITGGATNRSLHYYLNSTDAKDNSNAITEGKFSNTSNPQIIYVKVINELTNCSAMTQLTLKVSTTSASDATLEACDDDGVEDGFYAFSLSDADASVLSNLPNNLDLLYYQTYEDALLENNPLPNIFTNTIPYSQKIYARVENSNACYGISTVELTVFKMPQIELKTEVIYCLNSFPEYINIDSGDLVSSKGSYAYLWNTGETTSEIKINKPGTYNVRVSTTNNCFKDRTVTVLPSNNATITAINIDDGSQDNSISILVSGEGDYEYALNSPNGSYQDSATFDNISPGFHMVFVRDKNGCGISEELISVIGFPKYFTPNNDGFNDRWQVFGINGQFQSNSTISIYNRQGKLLKELDPLSSGWDGTFAGKDMPTSDYWFSVTLQDGRVFKGHFTLKR